jgi:hypothetical protein
VEPVTLTVDADAAVRRTVEAFRRGERDLTGLDLYYELERETALLEFHTMLRAGPQNRDPSGLQQSYGEHNRLLMFGLDRLVAGDVPWFRMRVDPADPVTDDELEQMVTRVAGLPLSRDALLALWVGGALHDCGMLCGRGAQVDVEDGIVLAEDVIAALCPVAHRPLARFALHHHDYIKDVFLGEVPAAIVADELDELDPETAGSALAALGMVQIAGAASLGEGRLSAFRLAVFHQCFDGTALDDRSAATRAGRLLAAEPERGWADPAIRTEPTLASEPVGELLAGVPVHGWHRALRRASTAAAAEVRVPILAALAAHVADEAARDGAPVDAVVMTTADLDAPMRVETALSGRRLLVVG